MLAGLTMMGIGLFVDGRVTAEYERLASVGVRVEGEVIEVGSGLDGTRNAQLRVAFSYGGEIRTTTMTEFDSRHFVVGGPVTVIVDPDDPRVVTVEGVERATGLQQALEVASLIAFLLLVPYGLVGCRRISMMEDAIAATGWRQEQVVTKMVRRTPRVVVGGRQAFTLVTFPLMSVDRPVVGDSWVAGPEGGPIVVRDEAGLVGLGRRSPFLRGLRA